MTVPVRAVEPAIRVYWTAFVGLFFDYYDLYLFSYLEATLAASFQLGPFESKILLAVGFAGAGLGALLFGYLADLFGRRRLLLIVFGVYFTGIAGISLATGFTSLVCFRLMASLALGAEWGISHTYMSENLPHSRRYLFSALLQFALLGGLLAALMKLWLMPVVGWRGLFALSLVPIMILSAVRFRALSSERGVVAARRAGTVAIFRENGIPFLLCFLLSTLTIASGLVNYFVVRDLPQGLGFTVAFWSIVAPGMLAGVWLVKRVGVRRTIVLYGIALALLAAFAGWARVPSKEYGFALTASFLNGIPFGLMGAFFNEQFAQYRTAFSGSAYNLGRILGGFTPLLIAVLGLTSQIHYYVAAIVLGFSAAVVGWCLQERNFLDA